jgi:hypothetical protein
LLRDIAGEKVRMKKGKFEKILVDPYLPNKNVPPEYIRDVLEESNRDFPFIEFEYKVPHDFPLEEYRDRYEELEHQMLEILSWRFRWLGKPEPLEKR